MVSRSFVQIQEFYLFICDKMQTCNTVMFYNCFLLVTLWEKGHMTMCSTEKYLITQLIHDISNNLQYLILNRKEYQLCKCNRLIVYVGAVGMILHCSDLIWFIQLTAMNC